MQRRTLVALATLAATLPAVHLIQRFMAVSLFFECGRTG